VFGKTNVPYMLADAQSYNDIYGTTNNPWDPTRAPGGSVGRRGGDPCRRAVGPRCRQRYRRLVAQPGALQHKPTWGLISTRGHAPPGVMTPTDISVFGPMARHAEDLDLALRAVAGPDQLQRAAWRVELPPPRRRRLGEFRVAAWASSPLCRIDSSVSDVFNGAIDAIVRAGHRRRCNAPGCATSRRYRCRHRDVRPQKRRSRVSNSWAFSPRHQKQYPAAET
jgi:amidase